MKRLCFGGSFNPIHFGHLICARAAAERLGFDAVVLIPSSQPPHKPNATDLADPSDRLRMCELAAGTTKGFEVESLELQRAGPSFTIDTARGLNRRGGGRVNWLIGADMLRDLPTWREPEALLEEVDFVVVSRPGWSFDWDTMPQAYCALRKSVVEAPQIDISATEIRRRVGAGLPIDFLTPEPVVRYIHDRRLYGRRP
jgi:nicotinate-nucleotide adenylyltransferase